MDHLRVEVLLELEEPLAHASGSYGNSSVAMRQKVRRRDGSFADIPIITGDTMRHGLREAGSYALLGAAGLLGENLSEAALRLLFAGGMVTRAGGAINLNEYREWVELVPPLGLLGGCAQNRVIPGQINVGTAVLVCDETAPFLPSWVTETLERSGTVVCPARAYVEEVQRVRMDPTLSTDKRALLTVEARAAVDARLLAGEIASVEGDDVGRASARSSALPFRYETVVRGSLMFWRVEARIYSEIDRDTFLTILAVFLRDATVGGRRGTGNGRLRAIAARNVEVLPFQERTADLTFQGDGVGELFRRHVQARRDRLRDFLGRVEA